MYCVKSEFGARHDYFGGVIGPALACSLKRFPGGFLKGENYVHGNCIAALRTPTENVAHLHQK